MLTVAAAALPLVPALAQDPDKGRFAVERIAVDTPPEEAPNIAELKRRVSQLERVGDLAKAEHLSNKIAQLRARDLATPDQDPDDNARTCDALRAAIKALRKSGNDLDAMMLEELLKSLAKKPTKMTVGTYSADARYLKELITKKKLGDGRYLVDVQAGASPSDIDRVIRYSVETDGGHIKSLRVVSVNETDQTKRYQVETRDGTDMADPRDNLVTTRIVPTETADGTRYREVKNEAPDRIQRLEAKVDKLTNIVEKLIKAEVEKSIHKEKAPRDVYDDRRIVDFSNSRGR